MPLAAKGGEGDLFAIFIWLAFIGIAIISGLVKSRAEARKRQEEAARGPRPRVPEPPPPPAWRPAPEPVVRLEVIAPPSFAAAFPAGGGEPQRGPPPAPAPPGTPAAPAARHTILPPALGARLSEAQRFFLGGEIFARRPACGALAPLPPAAGASRRPRRRRRPATPDLLLPGIAAFGAEPR